MSEIDDDALREQLSRWLDGDLPEEEARFFARRVQADPELAALARRWRETGALLREPRWREVAPALADRIRAQVAAESLAPGQRRRAWTAWAAAAAVAALALGLSPGMLGPESVTSQSVAVAGQTFPLPPPPVPEPAAAAPAPLAVAEAQLPSRAMSPVSAPASIADFALVLDDSPRAWPRSPLLVAGGDPAAHSVSAPERER